MARFTYTREMLVFIKDGYKKYRIPELTANFNTAFDESKTVTQIRACIKNNRFTCGRKPGFRKGEVSFLLSPEQVDFVKKSYRKFSQKELTAALNERFSLSFKKSQIVAFVKNHKITSGRTGRFVKGQESWNKGKKGCMGPNKTSFKKGHRPKNYRPVGSERICSKDGYVLVKVSEQNPYKTTSSGWYRHKHVVLWEEHFGPVPDGHCIRFKDSNKRNITIDNLILVSRGEHARLTKMGYSSQPEEIKPLLVTIAKIDQAILEKSDKKLRGESCQR